jgi:hypothetical protein
MKKRVFKVFTVVVIFAMFFFSGQSFAFENNVVYQLRHDLWYNGIKMIDSAETYESPDVVEAQEQAEDYPSYPDELTIPLYERFGAV